MKNGDLKVAVKEIQDLNLVIEKLLYWAAIIESSDDAIFGKTLDGTITSWNYGAQQLYEYKPEEIIGKNVTTLFPKDKKNEFEEIMGKLRRGEKIYHYETKRVTKSGVIKDISLTVSPIKDLKGVIVGASSVARDITERKRREERDVFLNEVSRVLSQSLDYKTTLKNISALVVPEFADWFSVDLVNKEKGLELVEVAHKDPEKVKWAWELRKEVPVNPNSNSGSMKVVKTGKTEFYPDITDEMLKRAAKTKKELEIVREVGFSSAIVVPLVARRKITGVISFIYAESNKKYNREDVRMAEQLGRRAGMAIDNSMLYSGAQQEILRRERLEEELRELERRKDQFISVASHELKTPIATAKGYAQLLCGDSKLDQKQKEYVGRIESQLNRMTHLVEDLLDISKIQSKKFEIKKEAFDVTELIKEVIEDVRKVGDKHQIKYLSEESRAQIIGDKVRLTQVFINLINNAIKYSPKSDKIIVNVTPEGEIVRISVQDFGVGIAKGLEKKIFEPFLQLSQASKDYTDGLGLGLYITKEIVNFHGGKIWVESKAGKGSTFVVELPLLKS